MNLGGGVLQFSSAEQGDEPDNVAPLEWEGLAPFEGAPTDEFIFSVFYQDEDGDRPKYVKLHLDDVVYLMQAEGKKADYLEGVVYSVKVDGLSWGPHEFSFSASDGTHEVKTFWEEGPFVEGDDPDFNHPPALWDNDLEPHRRARRSVDVPHCLPGRGWGCARICPGGCGRYGLRHVVQLQEQESEPT